MLLPVKRYTRLLLAYFPVVLVALQVGVNFIGIYANDFYNAYGLYLNTLFGNNMLVALFMLGYTFHSRFCKVSRAAAIAEVLFGIAYMVIGEDNVYNITLQIIIGLLALAVCFMVYIKIFPDCNVSLAKDYFKNLINQRGDCKEALNEWERDRHIHFTNKLQNTKPNERRIANNR